MTKRVESKSRQAKGSSAEDKPRQTKKTEYVHTDNAPKSRFTFLPTTAKTQKAKRGKKPASNETAHYKKATAMTDDSGKRLRFFEKRGKTTPQ